MSNLDAGQSEVEYAEWIAQAQRVANIAADAIAQSTDPELIAEAMQLEEDALDLLSRLDPSGIEANTLLLV